MIAISSALYSGYQDFRSLPFNRVVQQSLHS